VICAPIYSAYHGLSTQVLVGIEQGLKHDSSIHCDDLVSLPKSVLTDYVGSLLPAKLVELNQALIVQDKNNLLKIKIKYCNYFEGSRIAGFVLS
jgi:mRNA interferase MazF